MDFYTHKKNVYVHGLLFIHIGIYIYVHIYVYIIDRCVPHHSAKQQAVAMHED